MRAKVIIAEYNPLHLGHIEQIKIAKSRMDKDHILVILMSGSFCQRGIPAVIDKYERARVAIEEGADLVIELPTYHACSHAGLFAQGAINLIDKMGLAEEIICGSESADLDLLNKVSDILVNENEKFKESIKEALDAGLSYAEARAKAIISSLPDYNEDLLENFLKQSNDILALSYLSELKRINSKVKIYFHKRLGSLNEKDSNFNDIARKNKTNLVSHSLKIKSQVEKNEAEEKNEKNAEKKEHLESIKNIEKFENTKFLPASAIRDLLYISKTPSKILTNLNQYLSSKMISTLCLASKKKDLLFSTELFSTLHQSLNMIDFEKISKLDEFREGLLDRILKVYDDLDLDDVEMTFETVVDRASSKRYPKTRIRRALIHLILSAENFTADLGNAEYLRILAYNKKGRSALREIKQSSNLPIISVPSYGLNMKDDRQVQHFKLDLRAEILTDILRGRNKKLSFKRTPLEVKVKKRDI